MRYLSNRQKTCLEYLMIILGTGLMAVALNLFLDPEGMVPGGFTGIAIIVKAVTRDFVEGGVDLWITNLVLNVPLVPVVIRLKGWDFAKRTLAGFLLLSFWLAVIPFVQVFQEPDLFLSAVYGGALMGIGIGMVFLGKGTTGGTDMCGAVIQYFLPHISLPKLMQVLDVVITCVGIMVFGPRIAMYAILVTVICAKLSDRMMEGSTFSKLVYIISDRSEEIARQIMTEMDRGVTGLHGNGLYTNQEKMVLMCVVSPREIIRIKELALEADPRAFVIVNDSREVRGEGFLEDGIYAAEKDNQR